LGDFEPPSPPRAAAEAAHAIQERVSERTAPARSRRSAARRRRDDERYLLGRNLREFERPSPPRAAARTPRTSERARLARVR
jgi:hypothetical protein